MKTRTILGAFIMAALIGSSVGVGYAGGGDSGGGPEGVSLYQCYGVEQGSKPPHRLSIDDQFTNDTPEQVGKLKLLCTLANWSILEGPLVNTNGEANGDHLTCYEVSQVQATKSVVTLEDAFGTQTVKVQGPSRYVCVVAIKTCLSGCPVVTPP